MKQLSKASKFLFMFFSLAAIFSACKKTDLSPVQPTITADVSTDDATANNFDASVAISWMKMQMNLSKSTTGFDPGATGRTYAYSGLALYESIQAGLPNYKSIVNQLSGDLVLPKADKNLSYYWPAAANASMAYIIKNLFANTSTANMFSIDSLEADYNSKFSAATNAEKLQRSIDFGKAIATAIFDWSKTDGGHEAYLNAVDPNYIAPTGPGLWIPTPPAFGPPVRPHWGDNRSFIEGIATKAAMPAPVPYSSQKGSPFYKMVNQVYKISLTLTHYDTLTVKFWADLPGQLNGPSHFTNVLTQIIETKNLDLGKAAIAYAKHGIAIYDASIACFKSKYTYNLVRPVSYIQNEMGYTTWNPVIGTPPHPEYVSAHASIMNACATVLSNIFGANYSFDDYTNDALYGTRHYDSFNEYAQEGAWSRILGGIHYKPSGEAGLTQGKIVGDAVNKIQFKK